MAKYEEEPTAGARALCSLSAAGAQKTLRPEACLNLSGTGVRGDSPPTNVSLT
jgi:hypothetical protein